MGESIRYGYGKIIERMEKMRKAREIVSLFIIAGILLALMVGCGERTTEGKDIQLYSDVSVSLNVEENKETVSGNTDIEVKTNSISGNEANDRSESAEQMPLQQPPAEQAVNEAKPKQKEISISRDEQYKSNIFLSNFSEQSFYEFHTSNKFEVKTADVMELVKFAWIYAKINMAKEVEWIVQDNFPYYGVDIETINSVSLRFFDRGITLSDIRSGRWDEYDNSEFLVEGNKVCLPAADGETYNHMTVANKMYDLGDGTRKVEFTIYSISDIGGEDSIVLSGGIVQDKSVYYYTAEDANANQYFDYYLSGVAVVKPFTTKNGTATYQLLSYELMLGKQQQTISEEASDTEVHAEVNIPSNGITEEESYKIACDYWEWDLSESENNEHNSNYSEGKDSELYLIYNGLYDESDGNQYYEYLLRWKVPGGNWLSTVDFLYINAETGECFSTLPTE